MSNKLGNIYHYMSKKQYTLPNTLNLDSNNSSTKVKQAFDSFCILLNYVFIYFSVYFLCLCIFICENSDRDGD